jgi:hypothetical protein
MRRSLTAFSLVALSTALLTTACAPESGAPTGTGGAGATINSTGGAGAPNGGGTLAGAAVVGSAGAESAAGGNGGAAVNGGSPTGGADSGTGGAGSGTGGAGSGTGGAGPATGGAGSGGDPVPYNCTRVIGASQANEWYEYDNNYFETLVPNDKWELKAASRAQLNKWSDASSQVWNETGGGDAIPIYSRCANAAVPDRVMAALMSYGYKTREEWDVGLANFIQNVKTKYPSVKRIVLFTSNRCTVATCPQTANLMPPTATCRIYPFIDDAMAAAAAAAQPPGFVTVGPKIEHDNCADFVDPLTSGHLKVGPAQADVAKKIADYFNMK